MLEILSQHSAFGEAVIDPALAFHEVMRVAFFLWEDVAVRQKLGLKQMSGAWKSKLSHACVEVSEGFFMHY